MKKTFLSLLAFAFVLGASAFESTNSEMNTVNHSSVIKQQVKSKFSPFSMAIVKGDVELVKKMIALGADVNKREINGMTPAMFAARYNRAEILKELILNGANLKMKTKKGLNAKKLAKLSNAKDALLVIEKAADGVSLR